MVWNPLQSGLQPTVETSLLTSGPGVRMTASFSTSSRGVALLRPTPEKALMMTEPLRGSMEPMTPQRLEPGRKTMEPFLSICSLFQRVAISWILSFSSRTPIARMTGGLF